MSEFLDRLIERRNNKIIEKERNKEERKRHRELDKRIAELDRKADVTYVGYLPFQHQLAVHRLLDYGYRSGKVYVVKARRQVGKSVMVEQELLRYSITYGRTVSACVSPTLSQARKVFQDIIDCIGESGVVKKKNETLLEIELINGSRIFFKSAEQKDSLRGYTISGILCIDECAFISDDIFNMLLPWCNVHKAPILLTSTPKFKEGFYWSYWNLGLDKDNPNVISIDFNDYDTSVLLSNSKLEEYRRILPKGQFLTEYLGEFLDTDGVVFEGFKDCVYDGGGDMSELTVAIDWGSGGGNDYTVITALNSKCEQVYLKYFNDMNTTQQVDYIAGWLNANKKVIKLVVPELNSIGTPMTELLMTKVKGVRIEGATTTNTIKVEMVNALQVAFESRSISIEDDEKQLRELGMYECQFNAKTKNVTYNAPQGHNDDTVMALMIALYHFNKKNKKGIYNIR